MIPTKVVAPMKQVIPIEVILPPDSNVTSDNSTMDIQYVLSADGKLRVIVKFTRKQ